MSFAWLVKKFMLKPFLPVGSFYQFPSFLLEDDSLHKACINLVYFLRYLPSEKFSFSVSDKLDMYWGEQG